MTADIVERLLDCVGDPLNRQRLRREAADRISALLTENEELRRERDEAIHKAGVFDRAKDLSKQGWSALSDARLFLNLGTANDIAEAMQCIDLAQASFADTLIAAEARAESAEASLKECREGLAWIANECDPDDPPWRDAEQGRAACFRRARALTGVEP